METDKQRYQRLAAVALRRRDVVQANVEDLRKRLANAERQLAILNLELDERERVVAAFD